MNNKKNGFTLVELLAVITIVGLLALVAVPSVLKSIKGTNEDLYKEQIEMIKASTNTFVMDMIAHPSKYKNNPQYSNIYNAITNHNTITITLSNLQQIGAADVNILNPLCDDDNEKYFSPNIPITIRYENNKYKYEIDDDSKDVRESCVKAADDTL